MWGFKSAANLVVDSPGLLVLGSSLSVLSSFRLFEAAAKNEVPIAIVSIGPTRAGHARVPGAEEAKRSWSVSDILPGSNVYCFSPTATEPR